MIGKRPTLCSVRVRAFPPLASWPVVCCRHSCLAIRWRHAAPSSGSRRNCAGCVIGGLPDLLARVDLIVDAGDSLIVTDFKSSRSHWDDDQVVNAADQLLLYSGLVRELADGRPLRLEFLVMTKTKVPSVTRHPVAYEPRQVERTKREVEHVWRRSRPDTSIPIPRRCSAPPAPSDSLAPTGRVTSTIITKESICRTCWTAKPPEIQGSASKPYTIKHKAGVYSCSCPAWRNQSLPIDRRSCKHLRLMRGTDAEAAHVGTGLASSPKIKPSVKAPPLLLAETWHDSIDPQGWWLSEKLDGVRSLWDGKQFVSRQGNRFFAPEWFTAGLPLEPLDGELWIGRKQFQRTVSIVRRQEAGDLWKEVCFLIFDAPAHDGPFEERLELVKLIMTMNKPAFARAHPHELCHGTGHLKQMLAQVEAKGGEGLMLRRPGSIYEAGRSNTLLKVKTFHDAEAVVLGHEPGSGPAPWLRGRVTGDFSQRHPLRRGQRPQRSRTSRSPGDRQHHHVQVPRVVRCRRAPVPDVCRPPH